VKKTNVICESLIEKKGEKGERLFQREKNEKHLYFSFDEGKKKKAVSTAEATEKERNTTDSTSSLRR